MRKVSEKLRDQSGASILLALLFFLVCAMVGASVLMAAASNAGKSRGSRQEQQKYLTLSSALQLVCDELTAAEYTGTYTYEQTTYPVEVNGTDENGNPTVTVITHTKHTYTQVDNTATAESGFQCGLSGVLPLEAELDHLFSTEFPKSRDSGTTHWEYHPKFSAGPSSSTTHTLTLTVNQDDKPGLKEQVTVTVKLGIGAADKYTITLNAVLQSDPQYTMTAELTNKGRPTLKEETIGGTYKSASVTWTLSQITRGKPK